MAAKTCLSHGDYTVGWICALSLEMAAARAMLDEIHEDLPVQPNDHNAYILGRIGKHNIFPLNSLRSDGIGGGLPNRDSDIRLGDIVVSKPTDTHGGVVQYDYGRALSGSDFQRTGMLNRPPQILLTALAKLQASHLTEESRVMDFLAEIELKIPKRAANFARPTQADHLYLTDYNHVDINSKACDDCDITKTVSRPSRSHSEPVVHYGLIASANQVVKDSQLRDKLGRELGVYCVEMEAAGLMNNYPCLVVRGICDYADSHKNKEWQGYAAAVAAAYAKELLSVCSVSHIDQARTVREMLSDPASKFRVQLDITAVPVIGKFLGRQDELEQLWHYLQPASSQSRKVAILHGLGGMGKTQLAIQFARAHKNDFTAIFWLNGKDRSTLLQSLSSVLPRLPGQSQNVEAKNENEAEERARQVLEWLALEGNSRWLIIFDNINQYSPIHSGVHGGYDISEFFPTPDHGSILITSRLQKLIELGKSFPARRLESQDAIQLLLHSSGLLGKNTISNIKSDPDTLSLANRLDGLPLAIVIAGAFMRETGTSITEYLQYYKESWYDLQLQSSPGRQYQQGNMLQTWMISYSEIQKRDPDAAELLLLLSHFDSRDIWYELVKGGSHSSNVPSWLEKAVSSGLAFKISVKTLIGFSIIETKQQEGSYAMHPVVQDWCLHVASTRKNANLIKLNELALISVGYTVPEKSDRNCSEIQRRLIPHANYVLRGDWSGNNIAVWEAFHGIGDLYSYQGKLKEAKEMYYRALAGKEKAQGPDHTSTLNTVKNLGNLYSDQGKVKEAEEMYHRALAGYEKALGPDHTSTLRIVNNIGLLNSYQGKLKEAEEMYHRALAGYEKTLGLDHTSTLEIVNNLGNLYCNQDKLKETEEMYHLVLTGNEKALGPDHIFTLDIVNNLGNLFYKQGKLKKADEMYHRALAGKEKALSPDHTSTLSTVNNLGLLYSDQGKLKEAEDMYHRALAGYEKALGPDHTSTLHIVNNLGLLNSYQGKLKEAEEMYHRALAGYEKALGPDHTSTLHIVNNLGLLNSYRAS